MRPIRAAVSVLFRAAVFAVGVYVTYMAVVNAAIASGALRFAINHASPVHAHFEWSRAWSPWFMRVHTRDLVFRGEDSSVQWEMRFDRANASFGVADFFHRRVRLHDASASGVAIRVRFKVDPPELTPALLEKLPPMPPELANPPLHPAVMPPDPTDADYALWTVEVDDVVADHVHEVWFDGVRFTDTDGSVAGGFYLRPLREVWVRPTRYRLGEGAVAIGKDRVLSGATGVAAVTIATFDMRKVKGADVLRYIDASAKVRAATHDLRVVSSSLSGGAGGIDTDVAIERGVLLPGSRADVRASNWTLANGHDFAKASTFASAHVDAKSVGHAMLETYGASLGRDHAVVATSARFAVALRSPDVDLAKKLTRWNASVDVPDAVVPNLETLDAYFGNRVFLGGSARVKLHADLDEHDARNVKVDLLDVATAAQSGWWASLSASPLRYSLEGTPKIETTLVGKVRDMQLPLAMLGAPKIARSFVSNGTFAMKSDVRVDGAVLRFDDLRLIGDKVDVIGHVRKDASGASGAMLLQTSIANVGIDLDKGATSVHPFASHDWYDRTRKARAHVYAFAVPVPSGAFSNSIGNPR